MKKVLFLITFILFSLLSFGQNNNIDVVYLKNGSVIRGIIIEQVPNKTIKLETADKNIFVFQMDEVEKITKETVQVQNNNSYGFGRNNNSGKSVRPLGYRGIAEIGYLVGSGDLKRDRFKFDIINSVQMNQYFALGFGTGIRYYFKDELVILPYYFDLRATLMNSEISPYLSVGIGYSLNASNSFKGFGFMLIPTAGMSFKVTERSDINIGLGYEMQRTKVYYYSYSGGGYYSTENVGAINLILGFTF